MATTTTTTAPLRIPASSTGRTASVGHRLFAALRRVHSVLADIVDGGQLGPGPDVAVSRHSGGRI